MMLTKPRTVCACQPVAFMISASVALFARFIMAMSLLRSALGLAIVLLARPGFFAGLAFFAGLRFPFGFAVLAPARCSRKRLCFRSLVSPLPLFAAHTSLGFGETASEICSDYALVGLLDRACRAQTIRAFGRRASCFMGAKMYLASDTGAATTMGLLRPGVEALL